VHDTTDDISDVLVYTGGGGGGYGVRYFATENEGKTNKIENNKGMWQRWKR
jgi:hypothetical protein